MNEMSSKEEFVPYKQSFKKIGGSDWNGAWDKLPRLFTIIIILTICYICHTIKQKGYNIWDLKSLHMKRKMRTFDDMLNEQLKDINFKKEYEDIQPEMDVIRAIVDARTAKNLTQKELSKITGINQADISKLENGTRNPTLSLLKRLAEGMGMELRIQFIPKNNII